MPKGWLSSAAVIAMLSFAPAIGATQGGIATVAVQSVGAGDSTGFDGVVEAVRQTVVAAQVSGAVVALAVKAGDVVKAGQVLARIDAHAAEQTVAASEAQVQSARASLEVATKEFERQKQLFRKNYTSQAALERAEAQFKATQSAVAAQIAQASVARTQSGFFVVKAPYAGVIADVPVTLGDMAMPGRSLLTIYDPDALRVTAAVPQTAVAGWSDETNARIEFPDLLPDRRWVKPSRVTLLPTVDPGTHTAQVRLDLPKGMPGIRPGMFARVWLPGRQGTSVRYFVPSAAVVRRAEMTGLYVVDASGRTFLRQVRLGRPIGDNVEILAGVSAGERIALDPQAAARAQ